MTTLARRPEPSRARKFKGGVASFVRTVIESELEKISFDPGDNYNPLLNSAAFAIGRMIAGAERVGAPAPSREEGERLLRGMATSSGYIARRGNARACSTIRSGLDAGLRDPHDLREVIDHSDTKRAVQKRSAARGTVSIARVADKKAEFRSCEKRANACRIWNEATPIDAGDVDCPAVTYMRNRIGDDAFTRLPLNLLQRLRFHPSCPVGDGAAEREQHPALVAQLVDTATGESTGAIQRIFLAANGSKKADIDAPRQSLSAFGENGAVVFGLITPSTTVYEVEGVEKALAVIASFPETAVIAVLGINRFGRVALPDGCKRIVVGDAKTEQDRAAAWKAAEKRADLDGKPIGVAFPGAGFGDTDEHCLKAGVDGPDGLRTSLEKVEWLEFSPGATADAAEPEPWPRLGDEALTGLAGDVVRAATKQSEADPVAVLMTFLTMAGIAIGRGPYIKISDTCHHARLFSAIVGASARGRKGTSEGPVGRVWEAAAAKLGDPVGSLKWKPGPMSSGEGLIYQIRDGEPEEGDGGGDPGDDDKRLLVVEGEFGAALRAIKRENNTLSAILRSAWDGRTIQPLTKASRITATEPHIGVVAHITEIELKALLNNVEIFNGFANRFLWVCARRSRMLPLARGMEEDDVERYGFILAEHVKAAREFNQIEFSEEARRQYEKLYTTELSVDQPGLFGTVVQRAEVQVVRLALVYALLDVSETIEARHLEAGLAVWRYCNASAKRIFGGTNQDPLEQRITQALARGPLTTKELHQALGGHVDGNGLREALKSLEGKGNLDSATTPTGGRPRSTWSLRSGFEGANKAIKDEQRGADL